MIYQLIYQKEGLKSRDIPNSCRQYERSLWTDLEKGRWHWAPWHAITRGHPSHHGAGSCCCTLTKKKTGERVKPLGYAFSLFF